MSGKPWLKLWTETLHDRKLRRVSPVWRWAWVGLLILAAETDDDGRLMAGNEPLNDEDLSDAIGIEPQDWRSARAYFEKQGMLTLVDGVLVVTKYSTRQAPSDPTAAERMQRWRNKSVTDDRNVTRNVTRNDDRMLRVEAEAEVEAESDVDPRRERTTTTKGGVGGNGVSTPSGGGFLDADFGRVCKAYENIAMMTGHMSDVLKDALSDYPADWIIEAIEIAVKANHRSWAYANGVLRKWSENGKDSPRHSRASETAEQRKRRYVPDEYADLIEH